MNVLLFSNGAMADHPGILSYGLDAIRAVVEKTKAKKFVLIPYAVIRSSHDDRVASVQETMAKVGCDVVGLHRCDDPVTAIKEADGILVSGGNTWVLNKTLHDLGLVNVIRRAVLIDNKPYIGWSAGTNIACPTIRTTNDMPIITPVVMSALNFVPFQINPHYIDMTLAGHNGETRDERIEEFLTVNQHEVVAGIPEGTWLEVEGDQLRYRSASGQPLTLFRFGSSPEKIDEREGSLQYLMTL